MSGANSISWKFKCAPLISMPSLHPLCARRSRCKRGRHVGVVTVTGEGGDALLEASLDAGADDVTAAPEDGDWEVLARRRALELCY